jgi:dihydrofolate reductase
MRKLKIQIQMSIDGFIAGSNGELDWTVTKWDPELRKYVYNLVRPVDCILMGKNFAAVFIDTWEKRLNDSESSDAFARKVHETQKIIFSNSMENTAWNNTRVLKGEFVEEISQLKQTKGRDIIVYGGTTMARSLVRAGLVDEYHLFINPVILGKGHSLFEGIDRLGMKLVYSTSFDCGITVICYLPEKSPIHEEDRIILSSDSQFGN